MVLFIPQKKKKEMKRKKKSEQETPLEKINYILLKTTKVTLDVTENNKPHTLEVWVFKKKSQAA